MRLDFLFSFACEPSFFVIYKHTYRPVIGHCFEASIGLEFLDLDLANRLGIWLELFIVGQALFCNDNGPKIEFYMV